jgi:indole-3-acetate monooxygenase
VSRADRAVAPPPSPVAGAAVATPLETAILAQRDAVEAGRRLPPALAEILAREGLFRLLVPRSLGGAEVTPAELVDRLAGLARLDGSVAWCAMIGATTGVLAAYLPLAAAREIFADPSSIAGGVIHPRGKAVVEGEAYRVSGRWPFASGCQHCTWLLGGCLLYDAPEAARPRLRANGAPEARMMLFPAHEAEIIDTWHVAGLRGTGSHDIAVKQLRVPRERSVWLTDPPCEDGPLYRFPVYGLLALGIAGVALGIARGAIDDLTELARTKVATGARRVLAERPMAQVEVARAEALLSSARAHVHAAISDAWESARRGDPIPLNERARLRLAATDAVRASAEAVGRMYDAGGGSAIYDDSLLQRRFRDAHVVTQHVMVAPPTYELVGRVLLGVDTDTEML